MDSKELKDVIACFDQSRTLLHYYPGRYAVFLLSYLLADRPYVSVREIRQSPMAKLLNQPVIKTMISGDGKLYRSSLDYHWPSNSEGLVVTLGEWGGKGTSCWHQTSRSGANLVLQFNLTKQWSNWFSKVFKESANEFLDYGHPISRKRDCTLGWARLDMDFETGEVLIEEIQTDLVREIKQFHAKFHRAFKAEEESFHYWGNTYQVTEVKGAFQQFNSLFLEYWSEAMLWATLWFCLEELGMQKIYYHDFETGALLKGLRYSKPPRSLYSQLPKKFCFRYTDQGPAFLARESQVKRKLKKAKHPVAWYTLAA